MKQHEITLVSNVKVLILDKTHINSQVYVLLVHNQTIKFIRVTAVDHHAECRNYERVIYMGICRKNHTNTCKRTS